MTSSGALGLHGVDTYFGHDISESVPEDLCLLGSVFYVADYVKYLEAKQLDTWTKVCSVITPEQPNYNLHKITYCEELSVKILRCV